MIEIDRLQRKRYLRTCRLLVLLCLAAAAFYLRWLLFDAKPSSLPLFYLLVGAELFNMFQASGFWYTIWAQRWTEPATPAFDESGEAVDVFITVCNEPVDVVEQTVWGATRIQHPRSRVFLLDDGPSSAVRELAEEYGVGYIARSNRDGAKAGNINNALRNTSGDFVAMFDADHVPKPEFLKKTMGGFEDERVAFVQTPQWYRNVASNRVAAGAQDQQNLFYGPILRGKDSSNAIFSCGTNVVFRRSALEEIGGLPEDSITEDLRVSLLLIQHGYHGLYVPIILAEGLGPMDVGSYFNQQMRWARGGFEILFRKRPFRRTLSFRQAFQYWLSFIYWFTGWAYAGYLLLPVFFLAFGLKPVQTPNQYPVFFLPYVFVTLLTMAYASNFQLRFRGLWFTLASFPIHLAAPLAALGGRAARFVITSKSVSNRSLRPVALHIFVLAALVSCVALGLARRGGGPSVVNNIAFALGHVLVLQGFVRLALNPGMPEREGKGEPETVAETPRLVPGAAEGSGLLTSRVRTRAEGLAGLGSGPTVPGARVDDE
ncbi:MAG: glycosyltransferase [Actinobacteria bacterium]|nr:MAG: glycosyltransferase [Actinomycetota bacterium]